MARTGPAGFASSGPGPAELGPHPGGVHLVANLFQEEDRPPPRCLGQRPRTGGGLGPAQQVQRLRLGDMITERGPQFLGAAQALEGLLGVTVVQEYPAEIVQGIAA